jgi:hypothetical protein
MGKRGQAGMEFLMMYGWTLIVVFAVIVALVYIVDFENYYCPPNTKFSTQGFHLVDQKFIGSDATFDPAKNLFNLLLQNTIYDRVTLSEINIKKDGVTCSTILLPDIPLNRQETSNLLIGKLSDSACQGTSKECYTFDVEVEYRNIDSSITHTLDGTINGKFESDPGDLWALGGPWEAQDISDNTLQVNDRTNEKINFCEPESPPDESTFTNEIPSGTVYWDLPTACSTSGVAQVGFDSVNCDDRSQLSNGWIHNTLYLDNIFSLYSIFIGGEAEYYDTVAGETKTNGICLNDNLYFYVNGNLSYWGGTTGIMVGESNTYEVGDEVLQNCIGCEDVDSSGWCIPAFELTTDGFNFGETNNIDILVEDFCKGGGQAHAGGMSELKLTLV